MGLPVRRTFGEALGSAFCFVAVLTALVAIDERVRDRMSLMFSDASVGHGWSARASEIMDVVVQAAHDQSIAHAPMLIFTMVAVVLVLFMLRT
jgi:hypothetical protein